MSEGDQRVGLRPEFRDADEQKKRRHQRKPGRIEEEQPKRDEHDHAGLEDLTPEIDQRVARLVGIARHPRHHSADTVPPVISEIEPLDLDQDAFAQGRGQSCPIASESSPAPYCTALRASARPMSSVPQNQARS